MTDPISGQDPQIPLESGFSRAPGYQSGQPYPQAPQYPHWQHVSYPKTNGFAIAALTCSFFGFLGGILGVIFGCVALNQISHRNQRGRGMAIAGTVIGACWVAMLIIGIIVASVMSPPA